ncbi:RNA polymerase sigma factor [Amycolatopsis anabasis]|uniref:RNA polymerase sigma factor n=1 Tax=Amycolatopsis anabasis TaxID=1840409 RepID=UPI00131D6C2F|nr:sigma-70 family RNA polymerase sigma factor [Amycolatopsis anabasis]
MSELETGVLVQRALGGDQLAWNALVRGLSQVIFGVARAYRLGDADALDICQSTWLSLVRQVAVLREPGRLPGWLATTARRHALRVLARRDREAAGEGENRLDPASPEVSALSTERDRAFWAAVARLPPRSRRLVWLLAYRPELTHAELAAELGIRPGSVGPLRKRCFDSLRARLRADGFVYP